MYYAVLLTQLLHLMVSGKISTPLSSCVWVYSYQVSFTYEGVEGAPPPTWAASAGPEDNNLEVKLYWDKIYGMLVQEMENISGSKARSVARTASIEIEISDASTM